MFSQKKSCFTDPALQKMAAIIRSEIIDVGEHVSFDDIGELFCLKFAHAPT